MKDPIKLPEYTKLSGETDSPADLARRLKDAHEETTHKANTEVVYPEGKRYTPIKSS